MNLIDLVKNNYEVIIVTIIVVTLLTLKFYNIYYKAKNKYKYMLKKD